MSSEGTWDNCSLHLSKKVIVNSVAYPPRWLWNIRDPLWNQLNSLFVKVQPYPDYIKIQAKFALILHILYPALTFFRPSCWLLSLAILSLWSQWKDITPVKLDWNTDVFLSDGTSVFFIWFHLENYFGVLGCLFRKAAYNYLMSNRCKQCFKILFSALVVFDG